MPDAHSRLGPSGAERWMSCPASVRMGEGIGSERDDSSPWATEGTNAHTLAELTARRDLLGTEVDLTEWAALVTEDQATEMAAYVEGYVDYLREARAAMPHSVLLLEQRVETGVPGCWGTADAVLVSPTHIRIVDFKYGKGIRVDAEGNPQLMLYGVGALETYGDLLGEVEEVTVSVYQPRISHHDSWTLPAAELRGWRDTVVIPVADEALNAPEPRFGPSETACRWCPAAGDCNARTDLILAEFRAEDEAPNLMSPERLAEVLDLLPDFKNWLTAIEEAALRRAYAEGEKIPGWKAVLSGGRRVVNDEPAAVQTLIDAGYTAEQVARFKLRTLSDLDRLVGAKDLARLLGKQIVKTEGRPSMARTSDPRPEALETRQMFLA